MSLAFASVLDSARSLVSSVVQSAKPQLSPVLKAAEPVISSAVEVAESGLSSALRAAGPFTARFDKLRLKSHNPESRRKGVERLSESGNPTDTELIYAHLNDESPRVRSAAVRALTKIRTPENVRSLLLALHDESFEVREAAARALGSVGDVSVMDALCQSLRDRDAAVRIAAAGALRSMGWRPSTRQDLAWYEITLANTPAPVSFDCSQTDSAFACGREPHQDTSFFQRLAAQELRESTDPARIRKLRADLRTGDLLSRISAVHDLAQLRNPEVTAELLTLFRHPDAEMRLAAAQALATRDDTSPSHFLSLLQDPNPEVRLVGVQFLGRVRHKHIAEVLQPLLSDANARVRQAVAQVIGD